MAWVILRLEAPPRGARPCLESNSPTPADRRERTQPSPEVPRVSLALMPASLLHYNLADIAPPRPGRQSRTPCFSESRSELRGERRNTSRPHLHRWAHKHT